MSESVVAGQSNGTQAQETCMRNSGANRNSSRWGTDGLSQMRRHFADAPSGVAATELAVLLPLIILLCIATVDFGRYARAAITLENAVRVGAEYGAARRVTTYTYESWQEEVEGLVQTEFGDDDSLDVVVVTASVTSLTDELPHVEVTGECTFDTVVPWWMLPNSLVIRRATSMQRYR